MSHQARHATDQTRAIFFGAVTVNPRDGVALPQKCALQRQHYFVPLLWFNLGGMEIIIKEGPENIILPKVLRDLELVDR